MADRINYVGSALAALDQALNTEAMLSRNDAASRAQAFALLAIADELRQIRETRQQHRSTIDREALIKVLNDLADEAHYAGDRDSWAVYLPPYADRILCLASQKERASNGR